MMSRVPRDVGIVLNPIADDPNIAEVVLGEDATLLECVTISNE